jgi:hypothetical protein
MRRWFRFPNPVDETSARLVAAGVVLQTVALLVVRQPWQMVPLVYGFVARVAAGPRFSPLGLLVTRGITPHVGGAHRQVPGPPKRFAQGIGATLSIAASIVWVLGSSTGALVLVAMIAVAATLESVFALCLGCVAFNRLMAWGVIPESVCEACADLRLRRPATSPQASAVSTGSATN